MAHIPFYVAIVPAALVWTTWAQSHVSPHAAIRALAVAVGAGIVAWLVTAVLVRDARRAGLMVLLVELVLLSKVGLSVFATVYVRAGMVASAILVLLVTLAIWVAARIFWKSRTRLSVAAAHSFFNLTAGVLAVTLILLFGVSQQAQWALDDIARQGSDPDVPPTRSEEADKRPDIFILMMDGYPRADVLAARMEFDNSPFLNALKDRGFKIASESHSGYMWTGLSLTSLLNMAYVEDVPEFAQILARRVPSHQGVRNAINRSVAISYLRGAGYGIVATSSGYEQLALRSADVWLETAHLTEFEVMLLESTFVGDLLNVADRDFASREHRGRVVETFELLTEIAAHRGSEPRFVLAHFPVPHQPAVFGPSGEPVAVPITADFYGDSSIEREVSLDHFIADYTGQLEHVNALLTSAIDEITAASAIPPIVIVLSDHGSASSTDWRATSWRTADPAAVLERTGTLFAALTPGHSNVFPKDVEIVHVLPLLFNAYFGTEFQLAVPPARGIQIPKVDADVLLWRGQTQDGTN